MIVGIRLNSAVTVEKRLHLPVVIIENRSCSLLLKLLVHFKVAFDSTLRSHIGTASTYIRKEYAILKKCSTGLVISYQNKTTSTRPKFRCRFLMEDVRDGIRNDRTVTNSQVVMS